MKMNCTHPIDLKVIFGYALGTSANTDVSPHFEAKSDLTLLMYWNKSLFSLNQYQNTHNVFNDSEQSASNAKYITHSHWFVQDRETKITQN